MGFLKMLKSGVKMVLSLDTATKMKIISGVAVLLGGIAIVAASNNNSDDLLLEGQVDEENTLPEIDISEDEPVELELVEDETE